MVSGRAKLSRGGQGSFEVHPFNWHNGNQWTESCGPRSRIFYNGLLIEKTDSMLKTGRIVGNNGSTTYSCNSCERALTWWPNILPRESLRLQTISAYDEDDAHNSINNSIKLTQEYTDDWVAFNKCP